LFSSGDLIDESQGTADAGRAVILKNHDWFLVEGSQITRVTFSGESLRKQDAWLSGDYLVWMAVAGTPGVYATHLPSQETSCLYWDNDPAVSLWVSGMYAAWVTGLGQGRYWIFVCRIDTGEFGIVGFSEERVSWQLAMDASQLVWLKKAGPVWMVMVTDLEEQTEECLFFSELSMHTPRVDGHRILLITRNCSNGDESCSELNVLDRNTGVLTQLTYFGRDSTVFASHIDGGRIAFRRESSIFPFTNQAFVGFETPEPQGWNLANASDSDAALNLAILLPSVAIVPWRLRRRIRRGQGLGS
jgi:hypothetical protein